MIDTQIGKVLFVHAGGTKTGTSALQNFLELEVEQLRKFGFSYENRCGIRSAHEITSGNGAPLYGMLRYAESSDEDLGRMILSYFNATRRAICSCEGFEDLDEKSWAKLSRVAGIHGVHLQVIFYVRDVMPFFWSVYDQVIKRHGEYRPFAHWATRAKWNHGIALRKIAAEIPSHDIQLVHYKEKTRSIFESFLSVLGIEGVFKVEPIYKNTEVNRSLKREEREALKFANSILGNTYSRELSDLLIYSNPNARSEPVFVSKRANKLLLDRFAPDVKWVNQTFFDGVDVVSVLAVGARPPERRRANSWNPTERNVADKLSYLWAINKLGTIKADAERLTMDHLNSVATRYWRNTHPDLPADFNVLAYLVRNPDVLFSGVDPIEHYLLNGRNEGRLYNFNPENSVGAKN